MASQRTSRTGARSISLLVMGHVPERDDHLGSGGGSGKVSVQDITLTRYVDAASPALLLGCCRALISTGRAGRAQGGRARSVHPDHDEEGDRQPCLDRRQRRRTG